MEVFKTLYYKYWLHQNESILVDKATIDPKDIDARQQVLVKILGIDDFGFLMARLPSSSGSSQLVTFDSDSTSLDPFENMICLKRE